MVILVRNASTAGTCGKNHCSGKGTCLATTAACSCNPGYAGKQCEKKWCAPGTVSVNSGASCQACAKGKYSGPSFEVCQNCSKLTPEPGCPVQNTSNLWTPVRPVHLTHRPPRPRGMHSSLCGMRRLTL